MKEDTQHTIGTKLTTENHRDAIHIAVLPVTCSSEQLRPSQPVMFAHGTKTLVTAATEGDVIGIVDPFLTEPVEPGDRFWLFIQPNTVNGMRHEWTHPVVDEHIVSTESESEAWLKNFAAQWNFNYDDLITEASAVGHGHHYITARDIDLHSASELGADHDLFWHHLENLTGQTFSPEHRDNFVWSCSC